MKLLNNIHFINTCGHANNVGKFIKAINGKRLKIPHVDLLTIHENGYLGFEENDGLQPIVAGTLIKRS